MPPHASTCGADALISRLVLRRNVIETDCRLANASPGALLRAEGARRKPINRSGPRDPEWMMGSCGDFQRCLLIHLPFVIDKPELE